MKDKITLYKRELTDEEVRKVRKTINSVTHKELNEYLAKGIKPVGLGTLKVRRR